MRATVTLIYALIASLLLATAQAQPTKIAEPLSHYSKQGPVGDVFRAFKGDPRLKKVAVVGLGVGSLAAYSEPGQRWTFIEIDEDVKKAAEDTKRHTFLRDAKGILRIELGDGRLVLHRSKATCGLLVIDRVSSDAIPIHLMTREAIALYRQRLFADGILVFETSNSYLDLESALANVAADANLVSFVRRHIPSEEEKKLGISSSQWLVMVSRKEHLAPLLKNSSWQPARSNGSAKVWTDNYSSVLDYLIAKEKRK